MNHRKYRYSAIKNIFLGIEGLKDEPWLSLWCDRLIQYIFIFDFFSILGIILLLFFPISSTNFDNALYFLSAMVQAQAAIVSLVITLTLIAIQMATSSYTPRVVDVIKKNPDMWLLLLIYLIAISYGFIVLKQVERKPDPILVSTVLILGIYTFATLFLYMKNTIALLRPDRIITMLVAEINGENIHQNVWTDDIFQPVFDVINASMSRFDVTTTRTGLNMLSNRLLELLPSFNNNEKRDIARYFCDHIKRSALVAIRSDDEGLIREIIWVLQNFGCRCCKTKDQEIINLVNLTLRYIALQAIEKDMDSVSYGIAIAYKEIAIQAAESELNDVTVDVVSILGWISTKSADKGFDKTTKRFIRALKIIGIYCGKKGLENPTTRVIEVFGGTCTHVADNMLKGSIFDVVEAIKDVAILAIYGRMHFATKLSIIALKKVVVRKIDDRPGAMKDLPILYLEKIGTQSAEQKIEPATLEVVKALEDVGMHFLEINLQNETYQVVKSLGKVSVRYSSLELEHSVDNGIIALKNLAFRSIKKGQGFAIDAVTDSLWRIGFQALEKKQEHATEEVSRALKWIALDSAENGLESPVETAVGALESLFIKADMMEYSTITTFITNALEEIGNITVDNGQKRASARVHVAIKKICINMAERGVESIIWKASGGLGRICIRTIRKGEDKIALDVVGSLGNIGMRVAKKGLLRTSGSIAVTFRDIGTEAVDKGQENVVNKVARTLGNIGIQTAENGLDSATMHTVKTLVTIGSKICEKDIKKNGDSIILALFKIGSKVAGRDLAAKGVANLQFGNYIVISQLIEEIRNRFDSGEQLLFDEFMIIVDNELKNLESIQLVK